jgi:prevent-host-death family protein
MKIVNVHAAKTHLSRLIEQACAGQDIVIARNNEPAVRLVPVGDEPPRRQRGRLKGEIRIPDSYFDPLPDDELERWSQ